MTVGDAFKRFRKHLNLSQTDVARTLKMKQQSYSRFERGESSPRVDDLLNLADTYGVSVDYLLGRSDEPHPPKLDEKTLALVRMMQETFQTRQTVTT